MKLGSLIDKAGLTKSNLMHGLKLGAGAAAFPFGYGLVQSQLLLKASPTTFAQGSPAEYASRAILGVASGAILGKMVGREVGDGMVASAVGSVIKDLIAPLFNPAAAAAQNAVRAAESSGQDQMSGVNPLGRGLAGTGLGNDPALLFGIGTPDMSAAKMFNGATVAIEQPGLMGANVAIEQPSNFAASFIG